MDTVIACMLTAVITAAITWYARELRANMQKIINEQQTRAREKRALQEKQSNIIQGNIIRREGRIVDVPAYDEARSGLVRSPTPADYKKQQEREFEQIINGDVR